MVNLLLAYEDGISMIEALNVSVTGFVVVLLILALLAVLVLLLSKTIRAVEGTAKKAKKSVGTSETGAASASATAVSPASAGGTPLPLNTSAGTLDTYNVDERTAAVIMAIVSHESGIPLNRLQFKSIKQIEK